jgi:hypothetical protein
MNTFLILLPQGVNAASHDFQNYFNQAQTKTQLQNGVFLVKSTHSIDDWYKVIGTGTPGSGTVGNTTPVILPVDMGLLGRVQSMLTGPVSTFLSGREQAA